MEYIILSLLILLIVLIIVLMFQNKNKKGISQEEISRINKATAETISNMSNLISKDILNENMKFLDINKELLLKIKELNEGFNNFYKSTNEFNVKLHDFINLSLKDEILKKINDYLETFKKNTSESIMSLERSVKENLREIREDNTKKLDTIEKSVNEKLENTLKDNLQKSFDNVIKQISAVGSAIGEIKVIASDVGSLKNVLTNVKTKGIIGEVILGNIIKDFLTIDQYEENVITKKGSKYRVEFAIKLPGFDDNNLLLPVDSKFPYEPYSKILSAKSIDEIKEERKLLRSNLLKYAKDVHDKYIDVPNTTDFAIVFLPLEGLYLEALNMGLFEEIQKTYKVNLTGPTTFTAFVTSLQVGFKTLVIQRRSSEIFTLLGSVKTEFEKFADALDKTQSKIDSASRDLEELVGVRTRQMNKKLKDIEVLDDITSMHLLDKNN